MFLGLVIPFVIKQKKSFFGTYIVFWWKCYIMVFYCTFFLNSVFSDIYIGSLKLPIVGIFIQWKFSNTTRLNLLFCWFSKPKFTSFFCKRPDNKHFRVCRSYSLCQNSSTVPLQCKGSYRQYVNKVSVAVFQKTSFTTNRQQARLGPQGILPIPYLKLTVMEKLLVMQIKL